MQKKNTLSIIAIVVVVIAAAVLLSYFFLAGGGTSQAAQEAAASSTVAAFGKTLQQVSLLSPDASSTIASTYGPYVAPELLSQWEADPASAPGRNVSSPWPDHIQIDSIVPQGSGYLVSGEIILMTSNEVEHGGNAGTIPVFLLLTNQNGQWQIVAYQETATSSPQS